MNYRMIVKTLGKVMLVTAIALCLPLFVSVYYHENLYLAFLVPIMIFLLGGVLCTIVKTKDNNIYAREGFIIVAASWVLLSIFVSNL